MSKPAVIAGWFTNVSFLTKIDVARVTIEIPKDLWEQYQEVLGVPPSLDGAKKYVAITRITEDAFKAWASPLARSDVPAKTEAVAEPEKATGGAVESEHVLCQEAGRLIGDHEFRQWLYGQNRETWLAYKDRVTPGALADHVLKHVLEIESKCQLDREPGKGERWRRMKTDYQLRDLVR